MVLASKKENGLCIIAVDAPDGVMDLRELSDALAEAGASIAADRGINVVLVTVENDALHLAGTPYLFSEDMETAGAGSPAESLAGLDCPVIIAASGRITGQGLELLLAGDIRLAAAGSSFSLPQVRGGMIPGDGGTQRLPRIVGKTKALELILTGQTIDGEEARRIGLINILAPPVELLPTALEMGRKMALQAPLALRYAKECINQGMEMTLNQGLRLEADLYFLLHTTRDRREGIEAFREKRKPVFEGK